MDTHHTHRKWEQEGEGEGETPDGLEGGGGRKRRSEGRARWKDGGRKDRQGGSSPGFPAVCLGAP